MAGPSFCFFLKICYGQSHTEKYMFSWFRSKILDSQTTVRSTYFSTWPNFRTIFSISFKVIMDSFADSGQETNSTSTAEQVKIANVS